MKYLPDNSIPFKKALRELVGGRYEGPRLVLFRRFCEHMLALERREREQYPDRYKFSPERSVAEIITHFKEWGVPSMTLLRWAGTFPEWRKHHNAEVNRQNAKSGWTPKKKLARTLRGKK